MTTLASALSLWVAICHRRLWTAAFDLKFLKEIATGMSVSIHVCGRRSRPQIQTTGSSTADVSARPIDKPRRVPGHSGKAGPAPPGIARAGEEARVE